jgi:hypothetical protein
VQYKQQANQLLSMHNYTPLVINGNDKNKQLTLLSQGKLALTSRKTLFDFCVIKSLEHIKKNIKWPRPLFRPKTIHVIKNKILFTAAVIYG